MTRAERRTRQRTRDAAAAGLVRHTMQAAPAVMVENPNRGKRGAARLDILGERERRAIVAARHDYRPLTVRQNVTTDRIGRRIAKPYVTEGYTI